jgi:glutamine synthetase
MVGMRLVLTRTYFLEDLFVVTTQTTRTETIAEIAARWKQEGIRYVICELPDMAGMPRSKVVPLEQWRRIADSLRMIGVMVTVDSGSNLVPETGYSEERSYGDSRLHPDLSTASKVPWLEHSARVICDPYWLDGTPLPAAPRTVLRSVLAQLTALGYTTRVAIETEFYLFQDSLALQPVFEGLHIFHTERNFTAPVLPTVADHLLEMGLDIVAWNAEYGTGQYEICYREQEGLIAADQAYTLKQSVKAVARQLGYHASFMTKPLLEQSSSGGHIHISLLNTQGENAFLDTNDEHDLSEVAYHAISGMLAHAPAALALLSPTPNCYRRFEHHSFAPVNLSWGIDDRTALVRAKNSRDTATHLENRLPSALANPYLTIATIAACIILGLQEQQKPHAPGHEPAEENAHLAPLPATLGASLDALERDDALRAILGEEFTDVYIKAKRQELARQEEFVRQQADAAALEWQRREYLADY